LIFSFGFYVVFEDKIESNKIILCQTGYIMLSGNQPEYEEFIKMMVKFIILR